MNVQINKLVKSLLQKDTLDECSVAELKQYADRHPYFGAAQLLLTKKMQTENHDQYNEQLQKTFLFFHNPLWVEQLLNETGQAIITKKEPVKEPVSALPVNTGELVNDSETGIEQIEMTNKKEIKPEIVIQSPEPVSPVLEKEEKKRNEQFFEPYHTVDYFASQGIKFKENENPADKFGRQLKSFTDWLKTMKKLPVQEIAEMAGSKTEEKVDQLAEHSLTNREVITEAMAEVWSKQGNFLKAMEIYSKLSLLDPSKNVYFAAKIEDLKKRI